MPARPAVFHSSSVGSAPRLNAQRVLGGEQGVDERLVAIDRQIARDHRGGQRDLVQRVVVEHPLHRAGVDQVLLDLWEACPSAKAAQWVQVSEKYSPTVTLASGLPTKRSARGSSSAARARLAPPARPRRRAPRLVGNGGKTHGNLYIWYYSLFKRRVECLLRPITTRPSAASAAAQIAVGQIGHRGLGLPHRFRRRGGGSGAARAACRPG